MGAPYISLEGCNTLPHNIINAPSCCMSGVLYSPVLVFVSSVSVKFFVVFMVFLFFVMSGGG